MEVKYTSHIGLYQLFNNVSIMHILGDQSHNTSTLGISEYSSD